MWHKGYGCIYNNSRVIYEDTQAFMWCLMVVVRCVKGVVKNTITMQVLESCKFKDEHHTFSTQPTQQTNKLEEQQTP